MDWKGYWKAITPMLIAAAVWFAMLSTNKRLDGLGWSLFMVVTVVQLFRIETKRSTTK